MQHDKSTCFNFIPSCAKTLTSLPYYGKNLIKIGAYLRHCGLAGVQYLQNGLASDLEHVINFSRLAGHS